MGKKKAPAFVHASSCILQRIPPQIIGEQVLRLLSLREICRLDWAMTDRDLRVHWWLGAKIPRRPFHPLLDVCLRYAIDLDSTLCVESEGQARWMQRRQLAASGLQVDTNKVGVATFRKLLAIVSSVELDTLIIKNLVMLVKINPYLQAITACHSLRKLDIGFEFREYGFSEIDTSAVSIIVFNNSQLNSISLSGAAIWYFLPYLPLRYIHFRTAILHLHLSGFEEDQEYDASSLNDLLPLRAKLESFSMTNFEVDLTPALLQIFNDFTFPALRNVNIHQDERLDEALDRCLIAIASCCPFLESFDVSTTGWAEVTDDAMVALVQRCPRLRSVILTGQLQLSVVTLDALLASCTDVSYVDLRETAVDADEVHIRCMELETAGRAIRIEASPRNL